MRKVALVSMVVAGAVLYAWISTDNLEDCILSGAKAVSTEQGAILVYKACKSKYGYGFRGEDPDNPLPSKKR